MIDRPRTVIGPLLLAAVLLAAAGPRPSTAQSRPAVAASDRAALEELNRKYLLGTYFNEILAPGFRMTQADGSVLEREAFIKSRTPPPPQAATRKAEDLDIRVFGDTGIVNARVEGVRYTDVYHRGADGTWLAVTAHITRIAEPPR